MNERVVSGQSAIVGEDKSTSVYRSFLSLFVPSQEFDVEYILVTYWWAFLVAFIVVMGVCEYTRLHWQVWCDQRRLRSFKRQCKVRKMANDLATLHGKCALSSMGSRKPAEPVTRTSADEETNAATTSRRRAVESHPENRQGSSAAASGNNREECDPSTGKATDDNGAAEGSGGGLPNVVPAAPVTPALASESTHATPPAAAETQGSKEEGATADSSCALPSLQQDQPARIVAADGEHQGEEQTPRVSPRLAPGTAFEEEAEVESNNGSLPKRIAAGITPSALLARFSSATTPLSPGGLSTDGDSSVFNDAVSLSASYPIPNYCCPRFSADEQRSMERRRQANESDWLEARRALENTKAMAVCRDSQGNDYLTPPTDCLSTSSSVTRRRTRKAV